MPNGHNQATQDKVYSINPSHRPYFTNWKEGKDIQIFGILLIFAGSIDLLWIAAYPEYALKVFGTTFTGIAGVLVKYQHPIIHWILGYGFLTRKRWSVWSYLTYLGIACGSEITTQIIEGYNSTRTMMIIVSLVFGAYIFLRRQVCIYP